MGEQDEQWPFFRFPEAGPRDRDARVAAHVRQHRDRGAQPPRRDRGLSADEIVKAAIAIADAEGPEAISMRRIARELNAGAMSLYWYVGSKEELLDRVLDAVLAEVDVPVPSPDWRASLHALAHSMRAVLMRHLWVMDFVGGRPPTGPNSAATAEAQLALLDCLDAGMGTRMNILMTVLTYVLGAVLREAQEIRGDRDMARLRASMTPAEFEGEQQRFFDWFTGSGRYPHLMRLMADGVDPDAPETRDERFAFGLDCVLDGIAARYPIPGTPSVR